MWLNPTMRSLIFLFIILLTPLTAATAHQPVTITSSNTSPKAGPILVDGTISFALRVSFTKANQERGFRASLKEGDLLNFEYLIIDKAPENKLAISKLPVVSITSPDGKKRVVKFTERSKFYEPYGRTNYLFLSRFSETAIEGIYEFSIKSKGKADITVSTGSKEIKGEIYQPATCPVIEQQPLPVITNAQAATLVGMKKNIAISCVESLSGTYRIAQEDGQDFALTKDFRVDRVNLYLENGQVIKATVG